MHKNSTINQTQTKCHHCGEQCDHQALKFDDKLFCCQGCKMVYSILTENGMDAYYQYSENPGESRKNVSNKQYDFLDDPEIIQKLLLFKEGDTARVKLNLPQIHCSSCLWLLENLNKLNPGIISVKVDFAAKQATVIFNMMDISLRQLVELLAKIGYEPSLQFDNLDQKKESSYDKKLLYKLGLAGFSFGNIMLLSFPEYLGFQKASALFFLGYINIFLAIPVLVYSGRDYLISAWKSIQMRKLNIDVPIALGMLTLFSRSVFEIITQTGEGFLDSFSGFVFFLLIGRWFQMITYKSLDFNRNYTSYFPISSTVKSGNSWITKTIDKIEKDDILLIRNEEIIPADSQLISGKARIDYSFVTGESDLISKDKEDLLYAGGKQNGSNIEVKVVKSVNQSYLTQLWNEEVFRKKEISSTSHLTNQISKYFTIVVISIAILTFGYWIQYDTTIAFNAFTAVLIVACPCALALAIPFTYGHVLRLLGKNGFFLKNVETIERIQDINHIVFDKTGTITNNSNMAVHFDGPELSQDDKIFIKSSCMHSAHPLSKAIVSFYQKENIHSIEIDSYEEFIGEGFVSRIGEHTLRLGSSSYIFGTEAVKEQGVFIELNGKYCGQFSFHHAFRKGVESVVNGFKENYPVAVLSGDNDQEKIRIQELIGSENQAIFNQKPKDKLNYIKNNQSDGTMVMMIGDGLNDAGALKQSDVGVVITEANNNFSPACDAILDANRFESFLDFIRYINSARKIIYGAFIMAFLYNSIGMYFAITGQLSPVIAAILMPLSSISVIAFGVVSSYFLSKITIKNR